MEGFLALGIAWPWKYVVLAVRANCLYKWGFTGRLWKYFANMTSNSVSSKIHGLAHEIKIGGLPPPRLVWPWKWTFLAVRTNWLHIFGLNGRLWKISAKMKSKFWIFKNPWSKAHENWKNWGFTCFETYLSMKMGCYGRQGQLAL